MYDQMTEKKGAERPMGIGEINTIRQILMGEQFTEFEKQLSELKDEVRNMRSEVNHSMSEIRGIIEANGKNIRIDMLKKVVDLENRLVKYQDKTAGKIKKDKEAETARLSKLFLKIGKDLGEK